MPSCRRYLCLAALSAFTGVAFGAFGAHGLRDVLDSYHLAVYKTGVEYQMWHALGLGLIATWMRSDPESPRLLWAARLMFFGILVFSGSLYLLSLTGIRWFGAITPFGGMAFLVAWLLLAIHSCKSTHSDQDA
ncbi:MAG: DUF423 domain-containing protein [Methylococcales bacterium]|nr:DUF423 domain-containing protein [Methylococcales bacterium]MEE2766769.1 DUF423 domain-containing protein [Pseudomonadota bacterium]